MAATWPTSVKTVATMYVAVNELQTNLSGAINNSVTTITLNSTTNFPTYGTVLIDNEVMLYTGISGATLTGLTRGFDGTSAAAHSNGAIVSFAIVADHHNVLAVEINAIESYLSNNLGTGTQPLTNGHRALASNASGKIVEATTTDTELGYLSGVTSAIQTQLGAKAATNLSNVASVSVDVPMNSHKFTGLAAGTTNGDSVRFEQLPAALTVPTVQRFLSGSGTYTKPAGVLYLRVIMCGPGGGGAGSGSGSGGNGSAGSAATTFGTASAGAGNGGVWGTVVGGQGGTNTSLGTVVVNQVGGNGHQAQEPANTAALTSGGLGGSNPFGGSSGNTANGPGGPGVANTGAGGSGASASGISTGAVGSGGGAGGYMDLIIGSPSATYSYAVGSGGAGGSNGTGGSSGGAGASGVIIVEEFYQ